MTRPTVFLFRMMIFLGCVGGACFFVFEPLQRAFMANAPLNGLILGVLVLGIVYNFRQVALLYPEVSWIDQFRDHLADTEAGMHARLPESGPAPRLLGPMAAMLADRRGSRFSLSALSTRSILDGILSRLDESRDLSRYNIGLLIFLGLLGTFWGLLETVSSIGDVISGLDVSGGGEAVAVFETLKAGLETPIDGMGTAFSSSLFGLAGSLVLGFLDLQASQSQNRFYNELEEWLSSVTRLSSGALGSEGEQGVPAYVQALLEQTAESLENLQVIIARSEEGKHAVNAGLSNLAKNVETLTENMRAEQQVMRRLAEAHVDMQPIIEKLAARSIESNDTDDAVRAHMRNVDGNIQRLVDETTASRTEISDAFRREIRLLARTIAAATGDPKQ